MPHTSLDEDTLEEMFEGKEGGEIAEWMINHVISGIDNATNGAYSDAVDELLIENGGFEDLLTVGQWQERSFNVNPSIYGAGRWNWQLQGTHKEEVQPVTIVPM